jgi:hypothetical protein
MNKQIKRKPFNGIAWASALAFLAPVAVANTPVTSNQPSADDDAHATVVMDPEAHKVDFDANVFAPDPPPLHNFDGASNEEIYGGKTPVITQRPLLELGRDLYTRGPFKAGKNWFGEKNLAFPGLMVFGDWRVAAGNNDNGAGGRNASVATQLTLNIDIKLTATERIHLTTRPLEQGGDFTEIDLRDNMEADNQDLHFDGNLDAAFFEGDLGAIMTGITGNPSRYDLPFAFGLMPLLVQNGVWIEDAFLGLAVTVPAKNSKRFNISNYDVTYFVGVDDVTTGAANGVPGVDEGDVAIFGVNTFIDANEGYWEAGYGFTSIDTPGGVASKDYHNLTVAFSKRIGALLSTSARVIFNFGQDGADKTADGILLLLESSLITGSPAVIVPYANFFVGLDRPQSLARAANAGGVLKNTGINFETDGLTMFPKLTDTGADAYGGAVGIENLFGLGQQLVVEIAAQDTLGSDAAPGSGAEAALGVRWQKPISHRFIVRADAIAGALSGKDNIFGVRVEFRWKF